MSISLIVALDRNRVIGRENQLPWRLPADLKRFRALTMGKPVIMGRKTFESIGRPLPGRHNIIMTRNEGFQAEGCTVVHSLAEALKVAGGGEVMVIGGAAIYALFLPQAERLYLTWIDADFAGDTFFPEIRDEEWQEVSRELFEADENNPYRFNFVIMDRRR